jgi:hypothetical protein
MTRSHLVPSALVWTLLAVGSLSAAASAETLALVGGTVIDTADWGRSQEDLEDAVVLLEGGKITVVGPRASVAIPPGARIVDAAGGFIVPGLTDGFAAINNQSYANAYLYSGITSIIAVSGGRRGELFTDADPGPHVNLLDSVGHEHASLEEHLRDTEALAERGIDIALLMYELTPDQLPVVAKHAEELGMGTIGELGFSTYADGIAAGIDAFVHTTRYSMDLAARDMARAVAGHPFSDDLESAKWQYYQWLTALSPWDERIASHAAALGGSPVSLMPTFALLYLDLPWAGNPWDHPVARILDPADINRPADRETGVHETDTAHQIAYTALARTEFFLEESYRRAGARYLAGSGTDVWGTMPGISLRHELEALVRIGHTPRQALACATSNFEATFASWGKVGQVRPGYRADVLVLGQDPRLGVASLEAIRQVILEGKVLDREALLAASGEGS